MRIEDVHDWLIEVDKFFEIMEILEKDKVKLVSAKFKSATLIWWEQTVAARARQQQRPIKKLVKNEKTKCLCNDCCLCNNRIGNRELALLKTII